MISKWMLGAGAGVGLLTAVLVACGGEEADPVTPGGNDAGSDVSANPNDSGSGPTEDAGPKPGDGGADAGRDAAIDAPEVNVTFGTCAAFTPCGGDEKGTWKLTGGCVSNSFLDEAKKECPGFTTTGDKITARGLMTADGTKMSVDTEAKYTTKASVPYTCSPIKACAAIQVAATAQFGFDKATCVENAGKTGCDCDLEKTQRISQSNVAYTKSGNTLKTNTADYDYCVAGTKFSFTDTKSEIPFVFDLAK